MRFALSLWLNAVAILEPPSFVAVKFSESRGAIGGGLVQNHSDLEQMKLVLRLQAVDRTANAEPPRLEQLEQCIMTSGTTSAQSLVVAFSLVNLSNGRELFRTASNRTIAPSALLRVRERISQQNPT